MGKAAVTDPVTEYEYVRLLVAIAPPLSDEQCSLIAASLSGGAQQS